MPDGKCTAPVANVSALALKSERSKKKKKNVRTFPSRRVIIIRRGRGAGKKESPATGSGRQEVAREKA